MEVEREVVAAVMAASDVDADAIEIDGKSHRRVLRSAETYMTSAGAVRVERWLYKDLVDSLRTRPRAGLPRDAA